MGKVIKLPPIFREVVEDESCAVTAWEPSFMATQLVARMPKNEYMAGYYTLAIFEGIHNPNSNFKQLLKFCLGYAPLSAYRDSGGFYAGDVEVPVRKRTTQMTAAIIEERTGYALCTTKLYVSVTQFPMWKKKKLYFELSKNSKPVCNIKEKANDPTC